MEFECLFVVAELSGAVGDVLSGDEGIGAVVAEGLGLVGEELLVEFECLFVVAEPADEAGDLVAGVEGVGVVFAEGFG